MGLLSWWKGSRRGTAATPNPQQLNGAGGAETQVAAAGPHGVVEVWRQRQPDVTLFEFGSAAESGAAVTLTGCCPVSDELEPCRWELVPATGEGAPQFRIVF